MKLLLNNIHAKILICIIASLPQALFSQDEQIKDKFIIENILIEGNSKTSDDIILENLSFSKGDTIKEEQINNSLSALRNLQFFNEVSLYPKAGSTAGKLILTYKIKEQYWPSVRFKGGFSELDGWYITPVSLNFDNIFGLGNFMDLNLSFGDRLTALNFNYTNPNIFESDLDLLLKISARSLNFVHYIDFKRWILRVNQGSLYLGFRSRDEFFRHFTFGIDVYSEESDTFAWRYNSDERLTGDEIPSPIKEFVGRQNKTAVFSINFIYDLRDHSSFPTKGWWLGSLLDLADKQLGGDFNFTRFVLDVRKYQTIFGKLVAAGRLKYGHISYDAPFYEKFYLGGPNSLRGFNDRILSPLGGGNQIYQADLEIRFPITQKNYPKHFLSGVLFFDSGSNVLSKDFIDIIKWESALGFGLRLNLPFFGIIRADVAKAFNSNDKKIQFSLGHTF